MSVSPVFVTQYDGQITIPVLTVAYKNGRLLSDILDFFAAKYSLTVQSDFFVNGDPLGGVDLSHISFHTKIDIKNPQAPLPSYDALMSFKQLMETLNRIWDVYWHIDNGVLRIEHELYYLNGLSYSGNQQIGLDLTLPKYGIKKANKYKYLESELPWREEWRYAEGEHSGGIGYIEYDKRCTSDDIKIRSIDMAIADIYSIWKYFDTYSDDGFVILQNVAQTFTSAGVPSLSGYMVYGTVQNGNSNMGWSFLLKNYWKYNRIEIQGRVNGSLFSTFTFQSVIRKREQIPIKFQLCCDDFDIYKLQTTSLGEGISSGAKERLKDSQMEITLRYE